jgi:hypothetical protein
MRASTVGRIAFLTLFLVFAAGRPAAAQFGLRGGVNLSRFVGGDSESDGRAGLNLGASIPLFGIGPVRLVPEIYYSSRGGSALDPTQPATTLDFELSYIEVPLLVRLYFPLAVGMQGYVGGGPAYAWNLDCKFTAETDPNLTARECGQPFQSFETAMNEADKGVHFNAGIDFPVGAFGGLNLDARLVRGLDSVIDNDASGGTSDVKNQSITLMLGWYLGGMAR